MTEKQLVAQPARNVARQDPRSVERERSFKLLEARADEAEIRAAIDDEMKMALPVLADMSEKSLERPVVDWAAKEDPPIFQLVGEFVGCKCGGWPLDQRQEFIALHVRAFAKYPERLLFPLLELANDTVKFPAEYRVFVMERLKPAMEKAESQHKKLLRLVEISQGKAK